MHIRDQICTPYWVVLYLIIYSVCYSSSDFSPTPVIRTICIARVMATYSSERWFIRWFVCSFLFISFQLYGLLGKESLLIPIMITTLNSSPFILCSVDKTIPSLSLILLPSMFWNQRDRFLIPVAI